MKDYRNWQTVSSKYLVDDRWLRLRADTCKTPNGDIIEPYYVFEYSDWVTCLAIDGDDAVLIRQYRHGAAEYVLEVVAGGVEAADTTPAATARRELAEEVGYSGGTIYPVGVSYANPANQTNKIHFFLAVGGSCNLPQSLEVGETIYIEKIPLSQLTAKMLDSSSGETFQSYHLVNLLFARDFIQKSTDPALQALKNIL